MTEFGVLTRASSEMSWPSCWKCSGMEGQAPRKYQNNNRYNNVKQGEFNNVMNEGHTSTVLGALAALHTTGCSMVLRVCTEVQHRCDIKCNTFCDITLTSPVILTAHVCDCMFYTPMP